MKPLAARRRRPNGMTLIEVMMAVGILVTGLLAIFALLHAGARSHQRAIYETEASAVASSVLAETRALFMRGEEIGTDGPEDFHDSVDYPRYQYRRVVIALDPARNRALGAHGHEFFVQIEVRWSDRGINKSIVVNTVVFKNMN